LGEPYAASGRRVVTAEDLAGIPPGARFLVPEGAILTPLALDLLRKRGQEPLASSVGSSPRPRVPLVVANWKSYKTSSEARRFAEVFARSVSTSRTQAVVCPPFTALAALSGSNAFELGAQDCSPFEEGAHTGEVAARHLVELGCRWVLVGHSERRAEFGETDDLVRRKTRSALAGGLRPIVCVGETREERDAGRASSVVRTQLRAVLDGLDPLRADELAIAYEPRWAIGRGVVPTDLEIALAAKDCRDELARALGSAGARVPVLYGGSVALENAARISRLDGLGGLLVGGASLNPESFAKLVAAAG
jgi:triosephosphate isomerase